MYKIPFTLNAKSNITIVSAPPWQPHRRNNPTKEVRKKGKLWSCILLFINNHFCSLPTKF